FAGVDERHAPGLRFRRVHLERVLREVDRHVRRVEEVVGEILLDDVTFVAEAHDEIVEAVRRVSLHDVPENRLSADLHHGLGAHGRFFRKAGPESAGEDDYLHSVLRSVTGARYQNSEGVTTTAACGPRHPSSIRTDAWTMLLPLRSRRFPFTGV